MSENQGTDRRSVATDAIATLGTIIGAEQKRDAIHIAVEPVVAAHILRPGEHVGFVGGKKEVGVSKKPIGIIDPFLTSPVLAGQTAWLFVYPRQITSLRHVWAHPAFGDEGAVPLPLQDTKEREKAESESWMDDYANSIHVYREELVRHACDYLDNGEYWIEDGRFEGMDVPDEFWDHLEKITGRTVPADERGHFFSCSC